MPFKEHTLLRSSVEIRIRCPDAADTMANENAVIMRTAKMFDFWFGNAEIEEKRDPNLNEYEKVEIQIVVIVLSICTTERLDTYIVPAISYAKSLAKEMGWDRVDMLVNGRFISI